MPAGFQGGEWVTAPAAYHEGALPEETYCLKKAQAASLPRESRFNESSYPVRLAQRAHLDARAGSSLAAATARLWCTQSSER